MHGARTARGRGLVAVTLIGALLVIGGFGTHLAAIRAPFEGGDEQAHVGYAIAISEGTLPRIETPIPVDGHDRLGAQVDASVTGFGGEELSHRRSIWVANNPPLPYVVSTPASLLGGDLATLLALRLLGVASAVAAVACTYLLGRELAGGDSVVGVTAAAVVATTMALGLVASYASLDAQGLAATTGTTWALARLIRWRTPGAALHLGAWVALATAVRPMSAAYALGAVFIALALTWRQAGPRAVAPAAARLVGPSAVLSGWFYALNVRRYGDPTGSSAVFDMLGRERDPLVRAFHDGWPTRNVHQLLTGDSIRLMDSSFAGAWPLLVSLATLGVALGVLVLALLLGQRGLRAGPGADAAVIPLAWVSTVALALIPFLLTAQHVSSAGAPHSRYLLPILPAVAVSAALLARRAWRWAPLLVVAASTAWFLSRVGAVSGANSAGVQEGRRDHLLGSPGPGASLAAMGLGALALVLGSALMTWRERAARAPRVRGSMRQTSLRRQSSQTHG